ncbi:MAG: hypothetical protein ALAOOOJD_02196 [bacterium]|nr:hypothetical protein [bacterium]
MEIKENNILFLIGAGCSKEVGIKIASDMVVDVDAMVRNKDQWKRYAELYYYLRSSIEFSEGIFGNFQTQFNIEKLLLIINELEKKEKNLVYPFIGNWNNRLLEVAGKNFELLKQFKELIHDQLYNWINIDHYDGGSYYSGFGILKKEIGKPLRIFSLNYDLIFERVLGNFFNIELGFSPHDKKWKYSNFENDGTRDLDFYLYKLHGSIDWKKQGNDIIRCDNPTRDSEIIFGTDSKLKSIDPFLFYVFEFRKWSLDIACKLILTVGYSFSDEYMNSLITQALNQSPNRRLLAVAPYFDKPERQVRAELIEKLGNCSFQEHQIITQDYLAKDFLESKLNIEYIKKYLPVDEDSPFL